MAASGSDASSVESHNIGRGTKAVVESSVKVQKVRTEKRTLLLAVIDVFSKQNATTARPVYRNHPEEDGRRQ